MLSYNPVTTEEIKLDLINLKVRDGTNIENFQENFQFFIQFFL